MLDLGGGTGALSAAVLAGLPGARVTVLDVDTAMLERRGGGSRRSGSASSFARPASSSRFLPPTPWWPRWRSTTSMTSSAKIDLYRAIHDALAPGGVFLNLDAAITEGPRLNALTFDRWAARMAEHGITEAEARGHFAAWADEDRYFPLDEELAALRRAGFAEVECFWRRGSSAICCALHA